MKKTFIVIGLLLIDLVIYLFLGLMLMNYDDFYQESDGEYWSLESMDMNDKIIFISFNAWQVLNVLLALYIAYRLIRNIKKRATTPAIK
jgi:hypothetical protein